MNRLYLWLYNWIDRIWQMIAETVFVRFEFDLPTADLRSSADKGHLIFAITNGGLIDWLILSSWCRSQGLGPILVANRLRILLLAKPLYFFQVLFRRRSYANLYVSAQVGPRLLFVSGRERKQPFVPTPSEKILCEVYSSGSGPYLFAPVYILWRKHTRGAARNLSEYLFGLSSNPNTIGKIWYLARRRLDSTVRALPLFSTAPGKEATDRHADVLEETEAMRAAKSARRRILVEVNQEMRVLLGPRYHSPYAVKETVLRDPEVQAVIAELEKTEGTPRRKLMSRGYSDLTEIVADYKFRLIEILYVLLTWLFSRVFDGLDVKDEDCDRVRELMKTKPVVFVPCHRSHLDYLVIPYVLFLHDMVTPHIAAGVNLSFWPVGRFLRRGGAFFIRRSFRGDKLYSVVLRKYVEYLLKNRFNIKFFIEGTRSRSGKMLAPAYGILKMVLQSYEHRVLDDIAFVPVSICYDEVPEQTSYQRELAGGQKVAESATQLLKSRKIIGRRFGKVYVRMAKEPLTAREIFQSPEAKEIDSKLLLQKTAFQICKTINDYTPLTPKSLVSTILLTHRVGSLTLEDVLRLSEMLAKYVRAVGVELSVTDDESFRRAVEQTMRRLQKSNIVAVSESIPRSYSCDSRRRILLNYYKNNAIHCFVRPSIAVLAFFDTMRGKLPESPVAFEEKMKQTALRLRNILKFEFFFSPTALFLEDMERDLRFFLGDIPAKQRTMVELIASLENHFEQWNDSSIYLRLLGDLIESYLTVALFVLDSSERSWEKKALQQKIVKYAEARQQHGGIYFPESISVQNYSNALLLFENQKFIAQRREGEKTFYDRQAVGGKLETLVEQLKGFLEVVQENPETLLHPDHRLLL